MNTDESAQADGAAGFLIGGIRLPRPFRVRRLGHFGVYVNDPDAIQDFYCRLLGFHVADQIDYTCLLYTSPSPRD